MKFICYLTQTMQNMIISTCNQICIINDIYILYIYYIKPSNHILVFLLPQRIRMNLVSHLQDNLFHILQKVLFGC